MQNRMKQKTKKQISDKRKDSGVTAAVFLLEGRSLPEKNHKYAGNQRKELQMIEKGKRIFTGTMAAAMSIMLAAGPVLAADTWPANKSLYDIGKNPQISKDVIDRGMKGFITIYKLNEENGNTSEGDGMYHSSSNDVYGEDNVTTDQNVVLDANGNPVGSEDRGIEVRDGIPNIIFSEVKIADIVNVAGHRTQSLQDVKDNPGLKDAVTDGEVGVYYSNLDAGFVEIAKKCGFDVNDYATVIDGKKYWSTDQMETILEKIKDTNGDGNTWTGETLVNAYVEKAAKDGKGRDFAATGAQLSSDKKKMYYDGVDPVSNRSQDKGKTVMSDMDLGLYLIAETGYYDMVKGADGENTYRKIYRDYVYDSDGAESANKESAWQKQANSDDKKTDYPDQTKAGNEDNNYNDDTDVEGSLDHFNKTSGKVTEGNTTQPGQNRENTQARNSKDQRYSTTTDTTNVTGLENVETTPDYGKDDSYTDAEDGTQNPYVIDTPSSPFLVSLPQTNIADLSKDGTTYKAGTVWQYDLNVYPKNNMTSITKKVVEDDGDTLTERQDYHIGQNIHQVIYADSPVTMYTKDQNDARRNKEYKISDTMSKGLTFQRVTRVALRGRVANPTKLSQFDAKAMDGENYSKYGTDIELVPGKDYKIIYTLNNGTKKTEKNYYADVAGTVPGYTVGEAPDIDPAAKDDQTKNKAGTLATHVNAASDGAVANGDEYVQSFTVELTDAGLAKLDHQKVDSQVIVEFDTVLNKNAVIGSADGKTFNTNRPTLTWRNQNSLERRVEGNPVHVFTYELDLTKSGQSTKGTKDINGQTVSDDHIFDAGDVSFTIQQSKQYDPDLSKNSSIITKDACLFFVQDRDADGKLIDGSYHVWTPSDGAIEGIITSDTLRKGSNGSSDADDGSKDNKDNIRKSADGKELAGKGQSFDEKFAAAAVNPETGLRTVDGVRYNANKYAVTEITGNSNQIDGFHIAKAANGKTVLATTDVTPTKSCVVTQLVSPAHTDTTVDGKQKSGLLKIRGLDSETYVVTEKSTSSHFNLLKNRFEVTLNSTDPQDGNLIKNAEGNDQSVEAYGACLSMDDGTVLTKSTKVIPLSHNKGIVRVRVQNYKTITLHTGGYGTWYFYAIAGGMIVLAVFVAAKQKKKKEE